MPDERPKVRATWYGEDAAALLTELEPDPRGGRLGEPDLLLVYPGRSSEGDPRLGTEDGIEVDLDTRVVLRRFIKPGLPGALGKLDAPPGHSGARPERARCGMPGESCGRISIISRGHEGLFEAFYRAIRDGGPSPIPTAEIRRVTALMDTIFAAAE